MKWYRTGLKSKSGIRFCSWFLTNESSISCFKMGSETIHVKKNPWHIRHYYTWLLSFSQENTHWHSVNHCRSCAIIILLSPQSILDLIIISPVFDASLILYRVSKEECAILRESVPMLNYTDITQNTYIQSWTVTEIMAREKCGHLAFPRTVRLEL